MSDNSQANLVKCFFKDSVAFLASVVVLVAGSYYLSAVYFSQKASFLASVIYLFSAISFSVLTVISLYYVAKDALNLKRHIRTAGLRVWVFLILFFCLFGYVGTIAVSAANINQAAKLVIIPDEYKKPNLPPEIPEGVTWGKLAELYGETLQALGQCNIDKKEILKRVDNE